MTIKKIPTIYTLSLFFFSIWLFLIGAAIIPAITTGSQIQFPNPILQTLFIASAATSTAGCLLLGAYFLGSKELPAKQAGTKQMSKLIKAENQTEKEVAADFGILVREEQEAIVASKKERSQR